MAESILSSEIFEPYAQALLGVAQDKNLTERMGQDVSFLLELLDSSDDLRAFLANPVIKSDAKKTVLSQLIGEQVDPYTRNFVMLLVDRRRIQLLQGIGHQFQELLRKLNQTVLAEVTSASELSEAQQETIKEKVKAMTGARVVELKTSVDPDLIGGVVIKVGSQIIDVSLRGQLRRLSLRLSAS